MTKFKVGSTYSMRSACDYNCIWTYIVVKRTAKTITIAHDDGIIITTHRIKEYDGSEFIKPLGTYSMSPTLRANKEVTQ